MTCMIHTCVQDAGLRHGNVLTLDGWRWRALDKARVVD